MEEKKKYFAPRLLTGSILLDGNNPIPGQSGEQGGFDPEENEDFSGE